jgi:2-keto-4-pentenoate hydratase/2-oxohepta-3-ene-1,7-dioic acid hydratase in catechol pathway
MAAPPEPVLFLKPPSAIVGDGATITPPSDAGAVHHEVELVVVVGRPGRAIAAGGALDYVLGYAVGLDLTLREMQTEAKRRGDPWCVSKGFDGAAPVSAFVARDEVGDGRGLELRLAVNGELRQRGNTSDMLLDVAALVAHASRFMTLERGDLLFTGTPAGVGPIACGDTLEATIERVGTLTIHVGGEDV